MVDRYDAVTDFTFIACITGMTEAIVARMFGKGLLTAGDTPFVHPERIIAGELFDHLMAELKAAGMQIEISVHH